MRMNQKAMHLLPGSLRTVSFCLGLEWIFSFRHFKALQWHAPSHLLISILSWVLFLLSSYPCKAEVSQALRTAPSLPAPCPLSVYQQDLLIFLPRYAWIRFSVSTSSFPPKPPPHLSFTATEVRSGSPHIACCLLDPSANCALFENPSLTSLNKE